MIPIRRMTFDWSSLSERAWFGRSPFFTHLVEALSLTFPKGERFFVDSVKRFRGERALAGMDEDIKSFIGQEAHHGRAHELFNAWVLSAVVPQARVEIDARLDKMMDDDRESMSPMEQLAVTCALEHFTAVLAELILGDEDMQNAIEPEVRRLLVWHAIEETEHKAVAFDVYQRLGGTYAMRAAVMAQVTVKLFAETAVLQAALMRGRGAPGRGGSLSPLGRYLWKILPAYLAYYRRDFHPWQRDPGPALEEARTALAA